MSSTFSSYLKKIEAITPGISEAIQKTVDALIPNNIKTFTYREHITGLLLGNVQSGKTSHVLGIISASADEGFKTFIYLTTDNIFLQEQTLKRAINTLEDFVICGEDNDILFSGAKIKKPVLIVLKKNSHVLKRWKNNLSYYKHCEGKPIFIIDDEGDAASLNTKVNNNDVSAINSHLNEIKKLGNSSIYLQVTATPQAILLQTRESGWKPAFVHYFSPGKNYLGGDFFYNDIQAPCIRLTKEDELDELRRDENHISDGLRLSLLSFLVTAAHLFIKENYKVCNFLVHPSVRMADHERLADKIGCFLNQLIIAATESDELEDSLKEAWNDLFQTERNLTEFNEIYAFIRRAFSPTSAEQAKINLFVMNSTGTLEIDTSSGINITVGGNSLGRGVTFPALQTVYYCRTARVPQADTFWQHCRMFGYDRKPELMRIYLPPSLHKLFTELNSSNRSLIGQLSVNNPDDMVLLYPPNIKPTRKNVIDQEMLNVIVGNVNYFPNYPKRKFVKELDEILEQYIDEGFHEVTLNNLIHILEKFKSEKNNDWSVHAFINCLKALKANKAENKAILIVKRNRNISKGTGTLLSQDDRRLGNTITLYPVLTLYRVNGKKENGWDGNPLWIPNIKLPEGKNFYKVDGKENI
ncbi:MAG: hypothetical protein RL344_745 [Pseudomonadota bacterium]